MYYEWNENSTLIFLNAYKKHPCLWNPYHVKYYNCLAKNEALKNIIKELNIPELDKSDCSYIFRYGQEQMRIIEGFQSQKPYRSSLAWVSVISSYTGSPANILPDNCTTIHSYRPQFRGTHNYSPLTKQAGLGIEHRNEGIQNVTLSSQTPNHAVADTIQKCNKKVQTKPLIEELKQVAVNTMEKCDKGIQNTIYVSHESCNNCQAFEKCSSAIQESEQVDRKIEKCPEDMQNVIGIKFKTVECCMPNFLFISSDGDCVPLKQTDFKLKRLAIDKCQNTDLCQDQEGAEKVCAEKGICSRYAIEIIKQNSALTQALLQCLEKIISLQERTKTHSVSSLALKKDDVNSDSFETTICAPCKFANDSTHFATSSAIELESPSCSLCLKETEKDNVIAMFIKTCLELMKHALVSSSRKYIENTQEKCVRKEDAIDTLIILNKIKECADIILKIYIVAKCSKKQLSNQFCEYPSKDSSNLNSIQTQVSENGTDQFTALYENSKDVEVLYRPPTPKMGDHNLPENQTTLIETAVQEKPSVEDKEITVHSESRDIDVTVSLPSASLRNSGTQYTPKQSQDAGVVTEHGQSFGEKISVGTQNHEPVLIRIMKCNNSGVLMLDKETCVRDAHVAWTKKRIKTCPVLSSRLSENVYRKCLVRESYNEELLRPGVSHVHEQEMNCIDYRTSSLTNKNYRYDRQCRSSLPHSQAWREPNIPIFGLSSHQRASRIPLYARSHKYTRRRIDRYKMSQSYM